MCKCMAGPSCHITPSFIGPMGHRFCSDCVHQTPPTPDGNTLCPICRTPFLCTELRGDAALSREIATTMVTCRTCAVKVRGRGGGGGGGGGREGGLEQWTREVSN